MEDLIKPHFPNMTEAKATLLSKGLGKSCLTTLILLNVKHTVYILIVLMPNCYLSVTFFSKVCCDYKQVAMLKHSLMLLIYYTFEPS